MNKPFFDAPSPAAQKLEALRQLFPQAVEVDDQGRIRVNPAAIQLALDPANPAGVRVEEDGYELRWVGKREAYHQAFVPTDKILSAAHSQSQDWDNTGNLLIKGDNLDALKLLRQSYFGKVKLIYIDPPYNTQSDQFIYRDDFSVNQTEVLSHLGYSAENMDYIKNIYGARTHSGWLSFMYPRLLLARDLLREDGVIFISIDDNEQAQLKLLCDEVFGANEFGRLLIWEKGNEGGNDNNGFGLHHEYVICYSNSNQEGFKNLNLDNKDLSRHRKDLPEKNLVAGIKEIYKEGELFQLINLSKQKDYRVQIKLKKGEVIDWDSYCPQSTVDEYIRIGKLFVGQKRVPYVKSFMTDEQDGSKPSSLIRQEHGTTKAGGISLRNHFGNGKLFSYPKPPNLIKRLAKLTTSKSDLILDFFAGSGTTAEAVMCLNAEDGGQRQFILVQIPQPIDPVKQKEAHTFVTQTLGRPEATIFEITAERIRRAGAKLQAEQAAKRQAQGELLAEDTPPLDTGFRVFELVDDPLGLIHNQPLKGASQAQLQQLQKRMALPQTADMERVLSNLLLAEGLPLTTRIHTLVPETLFMAEDVALLLQALPLEELQQHLQSLQADRTLHYLTVYAPWLKDDNLLLGLDTLMEQLGLTKDKLRLRG
jgi:adenine-specific DNA-methyltransferase